MIWFLIPLVLSRLCCVIRLSLSSLCPFQGLSWMPSLQIRVDEGIELNWVNRTFLMWLMKRQVGRMILHQLIELSYYDISLLYSRIHLKWISRCYCAKTIFESISLWRRLLPLYFLIRFLDRISHTFVLFKDVTLTWIDHLETWLCSDNMSCYYRTACVY